MAITQRGASWQVSITWEGKRYRRAFPTKIEASTWEAESRANLLRGGEPAMGTAKGSLVGQTTLAYVRDQTLKRVWAGLKAEHTAASNSRLVLEYLGASTDPAKVTTGVVADLVRRLRADGKSPGTVNRYLAALSRMLRLAEEDGLITKLPAIKRQKESEGRLRFLSEAEEALILRYFGQVYPPMADFTAVALDTGFRLGELRRLQPAHMDGDWLYLDGAETKSGRERRVPMTPRVRGILTRRANMEARGSLLFPEVTLTRHRHYWDRMVEKLEMRDVVFHTCRHTFCSRLVQRGVSILVVQRLAGHSDIKMTMRYAKLVDRNLLDAIATLQDTGHCACPEGAAQAS